MKRISAQTMTEARRIARNAIKKEIKRAGKKVSYFSAKEINNAAMWLIAYHPDILKQAKFNLRSKS